MLRSSQLLEAKVPPMTSSIMELCLSGDKNLPAEMVAPISKPQLGVWLAPVMRTLRRLTQENRQEFEASLTKLHSKFQASQSYEVRHCLKKQTKQQKRNIQRHVNEYFYSELGTR